LFVPTPALLLVAAALACLICVPTGVPGLIDTNVKRKEAAAGAGVAHALLFARRKMSTTLF
jgi:hypothetical protein